MTIKTICLSLVSFAALFSPILLPNSPAQALLGSDACKNVTFRVDNNYGLPITVERFELWSVQEGRWLNENFQDVVVPAGAQAFTVRTGESVEYGEDDDITQIRVHFRVFEDVSNDAPAQWYDRSRIDSDIANPTCVANKIYRATVNH
ncbi:hypothetical protein [Lyngbya confervoides]|uniref:Uncharacterized protein n=1 Tax=Lyngbya confervoides BDU141951 TaxID=1574623 RepID=A0ABD4SZ58_9CYAN|nr:hypothetical protein [Lyngbya confervoides]MCM1981431.1 hypothetical protein [Lyngbya confervoides BDU141951]